MIFQASDARGRYFLDFLNNDLYLIESSYSKEGSWIKYFSHLSLLYARVTRAIVNHAPIREYCLCFFSTEDFSCLYSNYPIEIRHHILYEYRKFNNY